MARTVDNSRHGRRQDKRIGRLQSRADLIGRRSARRLGIVLSPAMIAELRAALGRRPLPGHIRPIGSVSPFLTAYAVSFGGRAVAVLHDHRGSGTVCAFVELDDPMLSTVICGDRPAPWQRP